MSDHYAVIGNPISQSRSPLIHTGFAASSGQNLTYGALLAPEGGFAEAADAFRQGGGAGLNVTAPFKLDAFRYATVRHERARQAGAANCLRFRGEHVEAENFDGIGLVRDIAVNLSMPIAGKRVLLLGAGGASRGAIAPLVEQGPAVLVIANRTPARAAELAAVYPGVQACRLEECGQDGRFDIVINATSAGLLGAALDLPAGLFDGDGLAYDMTYGQGLTTFLRQARAAGVMRLHDGVGMLIEQAAEAFAWWRGVRPETGDVIRRMTVPLA